MNIESLIEYQNREIKFHNDYMKYVKNEYYVQYNQKKADFIKKRDELQRNEETLIKEGSKSDGFTKEYDYISSEIDRISEQVELCNSLEDTQMIEEKILEINDKIYRLNYFIKDMENQETTREKLEAQKTQLLLLENDIKDCYPNYLELKKLFDERIKDVAIREINEIKNKLSSEEIAAYENAKKANTSPPYISEYKNGFCYGCYKDVSAEVGREILKSGSCICPVCHRIVYIKK